MDFIVITSAVVTVVHYLISLFVGIIIYYLINDKSRESNKNQVNEIISEIVNFVIFLWVGKVLFNYSRLLEDPLIVFIIPSDSTSFYFAFLCMGGLFFYKFKQRRFDVGKFLQAFFPIFIFSSFCYEFIQLVWENNRFSFGYSLVLGILIIVLLLTYGRVNNFHFITIMLVGWSIGLIILAFLQNHIVIFGYSIQIWFPGFILAIVLLSILKRKFV
ncbi:hypothetical protein [Oceanobacillus sp. Castelsardo]|uniref:hypothetical protein n=1 Tax=Oceanobacillus sp. Castelsardo TaxID=1851204 RepID=UPI0008384001|nr:hypothetical protein [Oceanobacillus sp. Castelsardo]